MFLQFSFFARVVMYLKGTHLGSLLHLIKPEVVAMKVLAVRDHWGRHLLKCQTCDAVHGGFFFVGKCSIPHQVFFLVVNYWP